MNPAPTSRSRRPTRRRAPAVLAVSAAVGLAVLGTAAAEPEGSELTPAARKAVYPRPASEVEALARSRPLEFFRTCLRWNEQRLEGYTCHFIKQDMAEGKLQDPVSIFMKFREEPHSVYMKWLTAPNKGQEVLYVKGKYDDKLIVHPSGLTGFLFPKVKLDVTDKRALKQSNRPVTEAGMVNQLRVIIPECERAEARGDLRLEYVGVRSVGGRPAYVIRRTLPPDRGYPSHRLFVYIDRQFLCALRTEFYHWDGRLMGDYRYTHLRVNPPLTDHDFDPDNDDYGY